MKLFLSDSELLNAVKEKLGKRRDVELAELLRVSKSVVSEVRANRRKLPDYSRVVAFDLLGYEWAKMVLKYAFYDDLKVNGRESWGVAFNEVSRQISCDFQPKERDL